MQQTQDDEGRLFQLRTVPVCHTEEIARASGMTTTDIHVPIGAGTQVVRAMSYAAPVKNVVYELGARFVADLNHARCLVPTLFDGHSFLSGRLNTGIVSASGNIVSTRLRAPEALIDGPVICTYFTSAWGTFLLDTLLACITAQRVHGSEAALLVGRGFNHRHRQYLQIFGQTNVEEIDLADGRTVALRDAIVPSRPKIRDANFAFSGNRVSLKYFVEPRVAKDANEAVQSRFRGKSRQIFISRQDANVRVAPNERDLEDRLSTYGFETLLIGSTPPEEVARRMANAEIVVTPHGSNAANTLFAPPDATIIEIDHPRQDWNCLGVARALGQTHRLVNKVEDGKRTYQDNASYPIDIDEVDRVVREYV